MQMPIQKRYGRKLLADFNFSDKALTPEDHEIEVFHEQVGNDIPVLIITKKAT